MKETRKCSQCKQDFLKNEMVQYASPRAKTMLWYCKKCLENKKQRDKFSDKVCYIFGIKTPGPRIWAERKRLIEKFGYTDQTIIDCLEYLYNVKKMKKISETLYLINPKTVEEMKNYQRRNSAEAQNLIRASQVETKEYIVPVEINNKKRNKIEYNPDEWLDD